VAFILEIRCERGYLVRKVFPVSYSGALEMGRPWEAKGYTCTIKALDW